MGVDTAEEGLLDGTKQFCRRYQVLARTKNTARFVSEGCVSCVESAYSFACRLSPTWRVLLILALTVLFWSNYTLFRYVMKNHAGDVEVLEAKKCPACFGRRMCPAFVRNEVSFSGLTSLPILANWKEKHTFRGKLYGQSVVLKRLAPPRTFNQLDRWLCERARYSSACGVHAAMYKQLSEDGNVRIQPLDLRAAPQDGAAGCITRRLLDVFIDSFAEREEDHLIRYEELLLKYTLLVNGEPLIMQAFPADRGYPFCGHLGACGRWVVQEDCGESLAGLLDTSFAQRVELAYQVLQIAVRLTHTVDDFSFYMLDVTADSFAVHTDFLTGRKTVRLVDLERVLVVDRQNVQQRHPPGYELLLEAEKPAYEYADLETDQSSKSTAENTANHKQDSTCKPLTTCSWYSPTAMCDRLEADLNYYSVCRDVLSSWSDEQGIVHKGLLHNVPAKVDARFNINKWLQQCIRPPSDALEGRLDAKKQLLSVLADLRTLQDLEL